MKRILIIAACFILTIAGAEAKKRGDVVVVMSFNVCVEEADNSISDWESRKVGVFNMFTRTSPDIVGLQEVSLAQIVDFENSLDRYGFIVEDKVTKDDKIAVMYRTDRFTLLDNGVLSTEESGLEGASIMWVKLLDTNSDKVVCHLNVHLDNEASSITIKESRRIGRKVKKMVGGKESLVVTGNFNAQPSAKSMRPLFRSYHAARYKAKISDSYGTYNGWGEAMPQYVVDYIFTYRARPIIYKTIIESYGAGYLSAHYPISTIVKLK